MSDDDARVGTAYHESGHAVIARAFGQSVKRVSITEDESSIGRVLNAPPPRWVSEVLEVGIQPIVDNLRVRRWLERRIMISFAGTLAEEKKTGNSGRSGFGEVDLTDVERAQLPEHVDDDVMHTVSPHSDLAMILALVKRMAGSPNEQDAYCEWLRLRTANRWSSRRFGIRSARSRARCSNGRH